MKLVDSPSFCYIAPTAYLNTINTAIIGPGRVHLVLAHLVDTDLEYATFYKTCSTSGDKIIMDNSAYELKEPYTPSKLLSLAERCGAHAIVLPDYPFKHSSKTIDAAELLIPTFKDEGYQTFFVPQSERGDMEDWIKSYEWAANNKDIDIIGMSILGIPNALPHISPAYARVVMTQILIDRGIFSKDKHHHYLGLNAGPALEIPSLVRMGALDTVDSSNPVWMAILGHSYTEESDSYLQVIKSTIPVDFGMEKSKDLRTIRRIRHNILLVEEMFKSLKRNEAAPVWYAEE